jgi:signal transduction histidine kinase
MIGEILDFTQGHGAPAILASLPYESFIREVLEELREEAELRSVQLEVSGPIPELPVPIDPKRLKRVFRNVVTNAVEAIPGNGVISISFTITADEVITEIRDSGPGIAAQIEGTLFEPFATHGKERGTGLGLSICRKIMEDHRGWITGRNHPDGGAVFSIGLPLARPGATA